MTFLANFVSRSAIASQVVFALGDHNRGTTGFESRENVVENHVITSRIAGQEAVELLNRYRCVGLLPLRTEC